MESYYEYGDKYYHEDCAPKELVSVFQQGIASASREIITLVEVLIERQKLKRGIIRIRVMEQLEIIKAKAEEINKAAVDGWY